ncbi:hypothetical protein ACN6MT_05665 [Neobacillus niacini]|uniref:hypothetical protein n=1 Tax=Neobacillus niacini TaxID=86668 RepID=UPI003B010854
MRIFRTILISLLLLNLASCSTNEKEDNKKQSEKSKEEAKEGNVEVEKGLLNVEITIPASMFEGQDINTVIADAKKEGVKEVTQNEDGSLTYKMSKAKHKEMMKEMKESVIASVEEMKNSEDYQSIKDITYNNDFSEFTVVVDKAAFENSMDGFATMGLAMSGMMYQLYNGVDPDKYKVTISLKDEATQKVFDDVVYPDDLNEEQTEAE